MGLIAEVNKSLFKLTPILMTPALIAGFGLGYLVKSFEEGNINSENRLGLSDDTSGEVYNSELKQIVPFEYNLTQIYLTPTLHSGTNASAQTTFGSENYGIKPIGSLEK